MLPRSLRHAACSSSCSRVGGTAAVSMLQQGQQPGRTQQVRSISAFPSFRIASLRRIIAEKTANKFNEARVHEIGPDLAALEWLMECGATRVEMSDGVAIGSQKEMREYLSRKMDPTEASSPPPSSTTSRPSTLHSNADTAFFRQWPNAPRGAHLLNVDASDSAIANEGFKYLREVRSLRKLKLNFCDYFGDEALRELAGGRPARTLEDIEIVLNPCVSDGAAYWIAKMAALRRAHFYFLPYIANRSAFTRAIKLAIPRCTVTFPEVSHIGYGYDEKDLESKKK